MLSHYLESVGDFDPSFKALPVREPLDLFLKLLEIYLSSGINCKHLHEIKEKELFIIFRTAYTKTEMVRLLHPIMGQRVDFKGGRSAAQGQGVEPGGAGPGDGNERAGHGSEI